MEDEDRFVGLFARTLLGISLLSSVIKMFSSSWYREGNFLMKNLCPAFRQLGKVGEHFLHLVFLRCLQLKMINMAKSHIWGWHFHLRVIPPRRLKGQGFYTPSSRTGINSLTLSCHVHRAELTPSSKVPSRRDHFQQQKSSLFMGTVKAEGNEWGFNGNCSASPPGARRRTPTYLFIYS